MFACFCVDLLCGTYIGCPGYERNCKRSFENGKMRRGKCKKTDQRDKHRAFCLKWALNGKQDGTFYPAYRLVGFYCVLFNALNPVHGERMGIFKRTRRSIFIIKACFAFIGAFMGIRMPVPDVKRSVIETKITIKENWVAIQLTKMAIQFAKMAIMIYRFGICKLK